MTDPDLSDHEAQLFRSRIFHPLDARERRALARAGRLVRFHSGDRLMHQGSPPDGFFIVLQGYLGVVGGRGDEVVPLAEIGPGESVGEMSMISARPHSATVRAVMSGVAWNLPQATFEGLMRTGDPCATAILAGTRADLCRRLREAQRQLGVLAPKLVGSWEGRTLVESLGWEV